MLAQARVARDISYSSSADTATRRAVIRLLENATGRTALIRRASGYEHDVAQGRDFWRVMIERYGLSLDMVGGSLDDIPRDGPLLMVSNHPFGILDGLVMGYILSSLRKDFRLVAHKVFRRAEDLNKVILPVSFDVTKEAIRSNIDTRKEALDYLAGGGAVGIFPGGTVSTSRKMFGKPQDPGWRNFTAKMIMRSDATVVPIFFEGQNSRLFQIASHASSTLRLGLLIKEFKQRVDAPVRIAIGQPIDRAKLASYRSDSKAMMDFLREQTYALSPNPLAKQGLGYEFEAKYKV